MIDIYTGTPGSGKSLHLASHIRDALEVTNRPVIGNFRFKAEACRMKEKSGYIYIDNKELTPKFLVWFSEYYKKEVYKKSMPEEHITLIIDEAQLLFNAREWNKPNRSEWISFFTQHRKLKYHIIMVAQNKEMIDKQIRALIEYEVIHRKVGNIGRGGKGLSIFVGGQLHVAVKVYLPLKQKVSSEFFTGSNELYQLYDSYNIF